MTTPARRPDRNPAPLASDRPSWQARWWFRLQFAVSLVLTGVVLAWLLWGDTFSESPAVLAEKPPDDSPVRVVGPDRIAVQPDSPLQKRLAVVSLTGEMLTAPLLTVTGAVVASLRPGDEPAEDRWQFSSPELLTAYTDWQRARTEVAFSQQQLATVRKLDAARVEAQTKLVARLRELVKAGTDTPRDLAAEETNLIQFQLEGQKDVYEAETAARNAQRTQAALERQLLQAGVDPALLTQATPGVDIVVADVPESKIGHVRVGQGCQARFFGLPGQVFTGQVASVAPVLSPERRTLRVLFAVDDPDDRLKPGMFADVGLGTDPRSVLLVPADAVLHVGHLDYVLVQVEPGLWRVTPVEIGEQHGRRIEVREGLRAGDRVLGRGAILLKPLVVQILQTESVGAAAGAGEGKGS